FAGTVAQVRPRASRFRPDMRVSVNPLLSCGQCRACTSGQAELCKSWLLHSASLPGAFAYYIAVIERNVAELPDNVSFTQGAFAEPFACAVHLCRIAELTSEDKVVIYGAGPIGLFVLKAAQVRGVRDAVVVGLNEERLKIAAELGAEAVTSLSDS